MLASISAVDDGGKVGALDPQIEQLTVSISRKLAGNPGALVPLSAPRGERSYGLLEHVQHEHLRMLECDVGGSRHRSEFLLLSGSCAARQQVAALQHLGCGMVDTAPCPLVFSHGSHVSSRQHTARVGDVDAILGRAVPS
jgi:hypothetical protein